MASVNKAIIVGHLGADPEIRSTQSGKSVGSLSVATTDKYKDAEGNIAESTEWHRITVWGSSADFAQKYLKKGSLVYVEGKLTTRKWTDKEGVDRYTTEINALSLQGLDRKDSSERPPHPATQAEQATSTKRQKASVVVDSNFDDTDDGMPF